MLGRRPIPEFDETRIEQRVIDGRPADVYQAICPGKQKGKTVAVTRRARIRVRRIGAGLALLSAAAAAYLRFLRRWHRRGGAYTYDWIERRLGIDIRNVDRIIPELQDLKVGDEIEMPGYKMRVELLDKDRAMVVRSSNHAWLWAFELRPTNGHTRLISRTASIHRHYGCRTGGLPGDRARLVGDGARDAADDQTACRDPR